MKDLFFKDIIHLTDNEIKDSKIALNMSFDSKSFFDIWDKSNVNQRDVSYSYYSHYGQNSKVRNFTHIGQIVFGFVQLPHNNKRWLLVTVGEIKSLPDHDTCEHMEIKKYQGFIGRLIVEYEKGNTYSRYIFNLSSIIDKLKVVEILSHDYQGISFKGLDNVHLKFKDLKLILNGEKYNDYRNALSSVKGVYCLTDIKTGKLYIGSAYGDNGIAQRWENYINTKTGGNIGLINLYNKEGEQYFEQNFEFTLIEYFGMNADSNKITNRESYWKDAFSSKVNGYNYN